MFIEITNKETIVERNIGSITLIGDSSIGFITEGGRLSVEYGFI
jgi:hypothetical protein